MIVNNNTKIFVGDTSINEVWQGDKQIWPVIPYPVIPYVQNTRDTVIETGIVVQKDVNYTIEIQFSADRLDGAQATSVFATYDNGYCINLSTRDIFNPAYPGYNWHISNRQTQTLVVNSLVPDNLSVDVINTANISFSFGKDFLTTSPICLFSQSEQGRHPYPSRCFYGKIYYCKLWANGELVRDFVPVNNNGTQGFWDKVTQNFYTFYS